MPSSRTVALIAGLTEFGHFGYDVCRSASWDHPDHAARRAKGNPTLPLFNVYGADLETTQFCCTSGHSEGCRDSQAVQTWLLGACGTSWTPRRGFRRGWSSRRTTGGSSSGRRITHETGLRYRSPFDP